MHVFPFSTDCTLVSAGRALATGNVSIGAFARGNALSYVKPQRLQCKQTGVGRGAGRLFAQFRRVRLSCRVAKYVLRIFTRPRVTVTALSGCVTELRLTALVQRGETRTQVTAVFPAPPAAHYTQAALPIPFKLRESAF